MNCSSAALSWLRPDICYLYEAGIFHIIASFKRKKTRTAVVYNTPVGYVLYLKFAKNMNIR